MSASSSDTQSSLPVHWVQWSTCPPPRSTHSCALFVMSRTALLTVALSRLSSNGLTSRKIERLIPAQPNFHTLYKSEQCSFKHELFLDVLVSDESWDHKLSIHVNHSPQNQIFFIRQPFQKCIVFFWDTRYMLYFVQLYFCQVVERRYKLNSANPTSNHWTLTLLEA